MDALREPPKSKLGSMASNSQCRSDSGIPSRIQIICIGSSAATSTTKSNASSGTTESNNRRARDRRSSSTRVIIRGVRPELTSRRISEWRGSSIMLSTCPEMDRSCSRVPPDGREPPVTDEYVCGSRNTARVSAYVATDQKPSPSTPILKSQDCTRSVLGGLGIAAHQLVDRVDHPVDLIAGRPGEGLLVGQRRI